MSQAVILMYHSVDARNGRSDTWNLSVAPDNFAQQIEALVSQREVIPLEELARYLRTGRVPAGLAAITFDDGYENNVSVARPILESFNAPATLFLMTGAVDTPEFWWDRLERIIMEAQSIPDKLSLPLGPETLEIAAKTSDRCEVFIAVWSRLRDQGIRAREGAIAQLQETIATPSSKSGLRPVTTDEVEQLDAGILSVGAHTVTHPRLPRLATADLIREVAASKAICECFLGSRVTAFAYPFGEHNHRTRAAIAAAGYSLACTTEHRSIRSDDDCFALPRIGVGNWGVDKFIEVLERATLGEVRS